MLSFLRACAAFLLVVLPSQMQARTYVYDFQSREISLGGVVQDALAFRAGDAFFLTFQSDGMLSGDNWIEFDTILEATTRISLKLVDAMDVNGGFPLSTSYYRTEGGSNGLDYGFSASNHEVFDGGFFAFTPDFFGPCDLGCTSNSDFQSFISGYGSGYRSSTYSVVISSVPLPPTIAMGAGALVLLGAVARRPRRRS